MKTKLELALEEIEINELRNQIKTQLNKKEVPKKVYPKLRLVK